MYPAVLIKALVCLVFRIELAFFRFVFFNFSRVSAPNAHPSLGHLNFLLSYFLQQNDNFFYDWLNPFHLQTVLCIHHSFFSMCISISLAVPNVVVQFEWSQCILPISTFWISSCFNLWTSERCVVALMTFEKIDGQFFIGHSIWSSIGMSLSSVELSSASILTVSAASKFAIKNPPRIIASLVEFTHIDPMCVRTWPCSLFNNCPSCKIALAAIKIESSNNLSRLWVTSCIWMWL